jgi:hypothetical protein
MRPTPQLPPNYGWWLASSSRAHASLCAIEYLRPISEIEFDTLCAAYEHCARSRKQPEVEPLLQAYEAWRRALRSAASLSRLGPLPKEIVEKKLVAFLLVWRMAFDHFASIISSRFGKGSMQFDAYTASRCCAYDRYFGYRVIESMRNIVQHQERPPLEQTIERHPYSSENCDQEHDVLDLSVALSAAWLRKGCSATLRRDLDGLSNDSINMRLAVEEAMQGFEDILYAVLLATDDGRSHRAALVAVFGETRPNYPVLVEYWSGQEGEPRASVLALRDVAWIVDRPSVQPP